MRYFALFIFLTDISLSLMAMDKKPSMNLEQRVQSIKTSVDKRIPEIIKQINHAQVKLTLAIYKKEKLVEIWQTSPKKKKLKTYSFTGYSGQLGPKNKQGDRQIPEGLYKINFLHPNSQFYLSAKINYPNALDKKRAEANKIKDPGGDIFIHGSFKTVGCIPIGDTAIEELFYIIHKVGMRNIKVIMSPSKLPLPSLTELRLNSQDKLITEKYQGIKRALKELVK